IGCDGRWALGRVHLGVLQPAMQLAENGPVQVLFHGDLQNERELLDLVAEEAAQPPSGIVPLIKLLYRRFGCQFPARMKGAFCAAVLDEQAGRLVLATDILGSYPLYWHNN